jgi:BirA family biotin operon repressor/biotin-[acetyl-CoA-carboxylase] ligase
MPKWRITDLLSTDSTNSYAVTLFQNGADEGSVVTTKVQTNGRGRLSRKWESPMGGLWFSFLVEPTIIRSHWGLFPIITGISVLESLHQTCDFKFSIKWPNDVLLNQKKIAGILSQTVTQEQRVGIVIGVGINSNFPVNHLPPELQLTATTLLENHTSPVSNKSLLLDILSQFSIYYEYIEREVFEVIHTKWKTYSSLLNQRITVDLGKELITGIVHDLDRTGALLVKTNSRIVPVYSGDIHSQIQTTDS